MGSTLFFLVVTDMADSIRSLVYYEFAALQLRLKDVLGLKHTPYMTTVGQLRDMVMQGQSVQTRPALELPMCYVKLVNTALNTETLRANKLSRGILTQYSAEGSDAVRLSVLPMKFTVSVGFLCQDLDQLIDFIQRWSMASEKYRLGFTLQYRGIDFDISVEQTTELDVPEKEDLISSDRTDLFEMVAQARMDGYLTNDDPLDDQEVPLIRYVPADTHVVPTVFPDRES